MPIPDFNSRGLLPPGDYSVTFEQLQGSILVHGTAEFARDGLWRSHLVSQARLLVNQLWEVGIREILLDGSFVEAKEHPNDIDGYFEVDLNYFASGKLQDDLNALDPHKVWTWDHSARRNYQNYAKAQLPMWHRYRVELYPHYPGLIALHDMHGNALQFPAAFRIRRETNEPKGIVRIVRSHRSSP